MQTATMMRWGIENGNQVSDDSIYFNHPMMGFAGGNGIYFYGILHLITWLLVIAILVALLRWLWKKGDSGARRR